MKTKNSPDPLDSKIDELLANQPLQPSAGFTERVLAATEEQATEKSRMCMTSFWMRLALPIAALLVAAFVATQLISNKSVESDSPTLSKIELQEIFILEEGLTGLTSLEEGDLSDTDLLDALIFLNTETQS